MGLKEIPPVVFTMTNLKRLDIGWNRISTIPTDISKLVRLEELWINSNPLKEIPHDVSKCTNLKVIDLRDTQVKILPYSLGRLKRMVQLKTEGSKISKEQQKGSKGLLPYYELSIQTGSARATKEKTLRETSRYSISRTVQEEG
jgi:Leucine-rich repeat (LRR) protein